MTPDLSSIPRQPASNMYLSDEAITQLIKEDVPYLDLTTFALGIGKQAGEIAFYTRHPTLLCATEEAKRVLEKCGATVQFCVETGTYLPAEQLILKATGCAGALHIAWRIALNLLEYSSGIASRTASFVQIAKGINPCISVVTTRKVFPGTRTLMTKAIIAGGALPHRLGLSETILIFKQHLIYLGGVSGLVEQMNQIKQQLPEHKICVEVETIEDAWLLAKSGVDLIQLDKISLPALQAFSQSFKRQYPQIRLAVAGGITLENVKDFAATGVDLLVTSAPYFGKPADIGVKMSSLN